MIEIPLILAALFVSHLWGYRQGYRNHINRVKHTVRAKNTMMLDGVVVAVMPVPEELLEYRSSFRVYPRFVPVEEDNNV